MRWYEAKEQRSKKMNENNKNNENNENCPVCNSKNLTAIHFDGDGGYQIQCDDCHVVFWVEVEPPVEENK